MSFLFDRDQHYAFFLSELKNLNGPLKTLRAGAALFALTGGKYVDIGAGVLPLAEPMRRASSL